MLTRQENKRTSKGKNQLIVEKLREKERGGREEGGKKEEKKKGRFKPVLAVWITAEVK